MSITYSHENAGKLPGKQTKFDRNAPDLKSAFDEARNGVARGSGAPQSERGSDMVKQDRPIPTLRPGPGLAAAADSQAHSDRLRAERIAARHMEERNQRKTTFKQERRSAQRRDRNRNNRER